MLYRKATVQEDDHESYCTDPTCEQRFYRGLMVPVGEPDYEAAEQTTRYLYATFRTPAVVHPETFNDIVMGWTRQIVDAALGIGGDDA